MYGYTLLLFASLATSSFSAPVAVGNVALVEESARARRNVYTQKVDTELVRRETTTKAIQHTTVLDVVGSRGEENVQERGAKTEILAIPRKIQERTAARMSLCIMPRVRRGDGSKDSASGGNSIEQWKNHLSSRQSNEDHTRIRCGISNGKRGIVPNIDNSYGWPAYMPEPNYSEGKRGFF